MSHQQGPLSEPERFHLEMIREIHALVLKIDFLCARNSEGKNTLELNRSIVFQMEAVHRMLRLIVADFVQSAQGPLSEPERFHLEMIREIHALVLKIDFLCARNSEGKNTLELNRSIVFQVEAVHRMLRLVVADFVQSAQGTEGALEGNPKENTRNREVLKILMDIRDTLRKIQRNFSPESKTHELPELPEYFN